MGAPQVVKWALELAKFDIVYRLRMTVKAQVLADFLSDFIAPIPTQEEWELYIDGSSSSLGAGVGVLLKSPSDIVSQHAVKLIFEAKNNEVEYEALLSGLCIVALHKVHRIKILTDSQLITRKISESYQVKEPRIQMYLAEAQQNIVDFEHVVIKHVPHSLNTHVDALAKLASATTTGIDHPITMEVISKLRPQFEILEILKDDWMNPIYHFLSTRQIPEGVKEE